MPSKRIVLVGCGGMSAAWINPILKDSDLEIVGLVDLNPESPEKTKEKFGLECKTSTDQKALMDELKPDVVIDCTVPEAHVHVGLATLNGGSHLWSEKPMAASMDEARSLVEAAKKNGKLHAIMQNRRYLSSTCHLKKIIAEGHIGEATTWNLDFYMGVHFSAGLPEGQKNFRDTMEHVLLLDMAVHTFDQVRFVSGKDPVSVYCHEFNPKGSWYEHGASAQCIYEMEDGSVFNYRGSWCAQGKPTSWESEWKVIGTEGSAHWDGKEGFEVYKREQQDGWNEKSESIELPEMIQLDMEGHRGWINDVKTCMDEGKLPQTHGEDNIKSLAMVHAAIESAKTGRKIMIEEV